MSYDSSTETDGFSIFLDRNHLTQAQQDISELNALLERHGISCRYEEENSVSAETGPLLYISIDEKKLKRNAGAKRKPLYTDPSEGEEKGRPYTIADVKKMQRWMTGYEIAFILGINRATYFRRKKADSGKPDSDPF